MSTPILYCNRESGHSYKVALALRLAGIPCEQRPVDLNLPRERRAEDFRVNRIPKFLKWFERILSERGDWIAGESWSYADLSLFHLIAGLKYAFPRRMAAVGGDYPQLMKLHDAVAALPELQDYLSSDRRIAFSDGIFRHYPELDAA